MSAVKVKGRVVSVRPLGDGAYGVMLGPGPELLWYELQEVPPRLGAEVEVVADRIAGRREVKRRDVVGGVSFLRGIHTQAVTQEDYPTRVVSAEWLQRVSDVMKRPLYRYQSHGAAWMASQLVAGHGAILGDEMGCGKTSQAVAAISAAQMFPAIIVCPTSLKLNWLKEWEYSKLTDLGLSIQVIGKRVVPIDSADVIVINYELLKYHEEALAKIGARVIVFDESQLLKEPRPMPFHRAAVATRLSEWIGRSILLTGTPMMNRPPELWRQLHIAAPREWPDLDDFLDRYCRAPTNDEEAASPRRGRRLVTEYGRAENVDEIQVRMQSIMLRRLKSEVLADLPPKSRRSILVQLDTHDMQQYRLAENDVVTWLASQGARAQRATKALTLVKLTYLRLIAALGKLREIVPDYLAQWFAQNKDSPLVILAYHKAVIGSPDAPNGGILGICRTLGLRVATLSGSDSPERRQAAVDMFDRGEADVFVAPIKSAGLGLNLQRSADMLFVERLWVPSEMIQAEDRIWRLGQKKPVTVTYLDAAETVDEHIAAVLSAKQRLISKVVDDADEAFETATSVASRLRMVA